MPFMTAGDTTGIYYESFGKGSPLIFIHGWSMSGTVWKMLQKHLSPDYRLIVVDLRGHGRSAAAVSGYGIEVLSSDVVQLFDALELSDATLVGWSLGALVSLAACAVLQEKLASLILVSGTPRFTSTDDYPFGLSPKEPRGLSLRLKRNLHQALADFFNSMFTREEIVDCRIDRVAGEMPVPGKSPDGNAALLSLETLAGADLRNLLPHVRVPTLLVHGSRDRICLPDASRYMEKRIPDSTLAIIEGAGHAPMLSRPNELAQVMGHFLERVYGRN